MNPILYDLTETSFTSNGLGRLTDCLECVCHEERNGIFEVDFTYPVDGKNYDLIKIGRSIGVRHDDSEDIQPFDIVSYSKPIDGIVSFHAVHISYRTAALVASARNVTSLSTALSTMVASAQPSSEMRFSLSADFESNGYMAAFDGTPRSVRQLLGGVEGSVLDTYGGEYEFNKFDIVLHKRRGIDREFRIKYGVNLLSYKDDTDAQGTFSACIPFWKNNDAIVVGDIVDSGLPTMSGREDCAPLDLSDKFEGKPTKAQLEALALTYMKNRQTAIPKTSISVDFVRLQDIGFGGFDSLYECKLCDTIGVDFPRYGMSGRFKIVKTEFDVLRGKYNSMELGTLSTTLSEALGISVGLGGGELGGTSVEQAVTFAGTRSNAISRGECFGTYDKNSNTVTLIYHFYNGSDIPTSYTLFTIPEEYRPTTTRYGAATYTTGSGGSVSIYHGYITNGGLVRQDISGSCRSGFGVIQYILN